LENPLTNYIKIATSHIIHNIFVSGSLRYLLATHIYFVYLRSVVDSCSSDSNNDSDFDLEFVDS